MARVVVVAVVALVVASALIAAGFGLVPPRAFEVLAGIGLLVGVGAAFGAFDRKNSWMRARRDRERRAHAASRPLAAAVDAQLRAVDPVEHRRLDLGEPWPVVLVGPTGVTVVAVADRVVAGGVAQVQRVAEVVREVAASHRGVRPVAVTAVLVLPETQLAISALDPSPLIGVSTVGVGDLPDVLTRGPLVPMATVIALFAQLASRLGPGLRVDVV